MRSKTNRNVKSTKAVMAVTVEEVVNQAEEVEEAGI